MLSRFVKEVTESDGVVDVTYRVKSAVAAHRQEERLRQLTDSLRKRWPVDVNEARVADIIEAEESS